MKTFNLKSTLLITVLGSSLGACSSDFENVEQSTLSAKGAQGSVELAPIKLQQHLTIRELGVLNVGDKFNIYDFIEGLKTNPSYKSSHPEILSIDELGNIEIKNEGFVILTVSANESVSHTAASTTINLSIGNSNDPAPIKLEQNLSLHGLETLKIGDKLNLYNHLEGLKTNPSYSSSNAGIISVDELGNIEVKRFGTVELTISANESIAHKKGSVSISLNISENYPLQTINSASGIKLKSSLKGSHYAWFKNNQFLGYLSEEINAEKDATYLLDVYVDGKWYRSESVTITN